MPERPQPSDDLVSASTTMQIAINASATNIGNMY